MVTAQKGQVSRMLRYCRKWSLSNNHCTHLQISDGTIELQDYPFILFSSDVYLIFTVIYAAISAILVCIFMMDVSGQVTNMTWYVTSGILLFALILSFFSTNARTLEYVQKEIDFANDLAVLSPDVVDAVIKDVCDRTKPDVKEYHELIRKAIAEWADRHRRGE